MRTSHSLKVWTAGFAAVTLAACGEQSGALKPLKITAEQAEADIEALRTEVFTIKADGPADVASIAAALPGGLSATWDALEFDAASGATVLRAVRLSHASAPGLEVVIDEAKAWGLDAPFAVARLNGERLTETAPLARRLDLTGVKLVGLESFFGEAMNAYMGAAEGFATEAVGGMTGREVADEIAADFEAIETTIESYNYSIGRIVVDDVVLRPFELTLAAFPPDSEWGEFMPLLQTSAAVYRSFAADTHALFDITVDTQMSQYSHPSSSSSTVAVQGARGWRGGDTDIAIVKGMSMQMSMVLPASRSFAVEPEGTTTGIEEPAQTTMIPIPMTGSVDRFTHERLHLDKLLGYLARGEMPSRTDTDLLGIGVIRMNSMHISVNDAPEYSIGEFVMEAEEFHWFIPTRIRFAYSDLIYDVGAMMRFAQSTDPSFAESPDMAMLPAVMTAMQKHGLDKPSLDFDMTAAWNPKSGATTLNIAGAMDGFFSGDMKMAGTFPDFKSVSDKIPDNATDEAFDAAGKVFGEVSNFKNFEWTVVDDGGLSKSFAFAADIIAAAPPEDQAVAMVRNAGPDGLRGMMVNGIMLLGSQSATAGVPQMDPVVKAFAAFIQHGGTFSIKSSPRAPLNGEAFATAETPGEVFDKLAITATHTPPKK